MCARCLSVGLSVCLYLYVCLCMCVYALCCWRCQCYQCCWCWVYHAGAVKGHYQLITKDFIRCTTDEFMYVHTMYVCASVYLTYATINIVSFHLIYLWKEYTIRYLGNVLRIPLKKLNIFTKSGQPWIILNGTTLTWTELCMDNSYLQLWLLSALAGKLKHGIR